MTGSFFIEHPVFIYTIFFVHRFVLRCIVVVTTAAAAYYYFFFFSFILFSGFPCIQYCKRLMLRMYDFDNIHFSHFYFLLLLLFAVIGFFFHLLCSSSDCFHDSFCSHIIHINDLCVWLLRSNLFFFPCFSLLVFCLDIDCHYE